FLVSSHLAKQENHLPLDLPTAASAIPDGSESETVVVNVLRDGTWQVAGRTVNRPQLTLVLRRRAATATAPLRIRIRSDAQVPYRSVAPLLAVAVEAGIGDIGFSVFGEERP
ncbi:MAG: biopolymer transporter ExbD, partial [Planctomycetota bacterium]